MQDNSFSRRAAIIGAAVLPMIRAAKGQAKPGNIVISSSNGVKACAKAMEVIQVGRRYARCGDRGSQYPGTRPR